MMSRNKFRNDIAVRIYIIIIIVVIFFICKEGKEKVEVLDKYREDFLKKILNFIWDGRNELINYLLYERLGGEIIV